MSALLHIDRVSIGHPGVVLLRDASFEVGAGEITAIVGVNGSGKSTLLRTILGLHPPLAGRILVDGEDLLSMVSAERARTVSAVLSGRPRMGRIDVRTLVSLGRQPWTGHMGRLTENDHVRIDAALWATRSLDLADRGFDALSDGEAQKVLLARAIAQDTPVLVLDEPTAHLDVVNRVTLIHLLRDLARLLPRAVLLSTHDLATAMDLCDRILVIHEGTLWSGTPAEAIDSGILSQAFTSGNLRYDPTTSTLR